MKITKRQLRRIIKEEKARLLNEGPAGTLQGSEERLFDALDEYVSILVESFGGDASPDQLKAEVLNFVNGYFEQTEEPPGGWGS